MNKKSIQLIRTAYAVLLICLVPNLNALASENAAPVSTSPAFINDSVASDLRSHPSVKALLAAGPLELPAQKLLAIVSQVDQVASPDSFVDPRVDKPIQRIALERDVLSNRYFNDAQYHLRRDGGLQTRSWTIVRVMDRQDVGDLSQIVVPWSPWCEDRPEILARVITPDGRAITLSQNQVVDQAAPHEERDILTDRRQVVAMLSGVQPGCLIEVAWTRNSRPAMPTTGSAATCLLADFEPWRLFRVRITSDTETKWAAMPIGPAARLEVTRRNDQHSGIIEFLMAETPTLMDWLEIQCGPDDSSIPSLRIAHRRTWEELGGAYQESVDQIIQSGQKLVATLGLTSMSRNSDRDTILQAAVDAISDRIHYTGWSLGELAIQPADPDTVLMRRFGDCKDQSTLLVACLRQCGLKAHVSLLKTGTGLDISPALPALSGFDHAIVAVEDPMQPTGFLFIDPTYHCDRDSEDSRIPYSTLPDSCRGRWALVCDQQPRLVRTPILGSEENVYEFAQVHACNALGIGITGLLVGQIGPNAFEFPNVRDASVQRQLRDKYQDTFKGIYASALMFGKTASPHHSTPGSPDLQTMAFSDMTQVMDRAQSQLRMKYSTLKYWSTDESLRRFIPESVFEETWSEEDLAFKETAASKGYYWTNDRRSNWVQIAGETQIYRFGVRLPADMRIRFDEGVTVKQLGLMNVQIARRRMTSEEADTPMFQGRPWTNDENGRFVTWYQSSTPSVEGFGEPTDQCCLLEIRFVIKPGMMTPQEMRDVHRTMQQLIDDDEFEFSIDANWIAAENSSATPTADQIRQLIAQAASKDDKIAEGVAIKMLGQRSLGHIANQLADQSRLEQRLGPADKAIRAMLATERLSHQKSGIRPRPDCRCAARVLGADIESVVPEARILWLAGQVASSDGTLSDDSQAIRKAFRKFIDTNETIGTTLLIEEAANRLIILAGLAGHEDKRLLRFASANPSLANDPVIAFLENRDIPVVPVVDNEEKTSMGTRLPSLSYKKDLLRPLGSIGVEELKRAPTALDELHQDRAKIARETFLVLITAGRYDLAEAFQIRHPAAIPEQLRVRENETRELRALDTKNPLSLVRHLIAADILNDDERIRQLLASKAAADNMLSSQFEGFTPKDWVYPHHFLRSKSLANFVANHALIVDNWFTNGFGMVIVSWPFSNAWSSLRNWPTLDYRDQSPHKDVLSTLDPITMIENGDMIAFGACQLPNGHWQVAPPLNYAALALPLLQQYQPGAGSHVPMCLEVLVTLVEKPEAPKPDYGTSIYQVLGLRAPSSGLDEYRTRTQRQTEWTLKAMIAQYEPASVSLDVLLGPGERSILSVQKLLRSVPPLIVRDIETLLLNLLRAERRYDAAIFLANERAIRTRSIGDAIELMQLVHSAKANSPRHLSIQTNWRSTVNQTLATDRRDEARRLVKLHYALIGDKKADLVAELNRAIRDFPAFWSDAEMLNKIVWLALANETKPSELQSLVEHLESADEVALEPDRRCLIAIVKLKLGQTDEAIDLYASIADSHPDDALSALFFAEVATSLGLKDVASNSYRSNVERHPASQPATYSAQRLEAIGSLR